MSSSERRLVLTLHGIRTYGRWQERLNSLIQQSKPVAQEIDVVEYKYGVFTLLSFLVPFLRRVAVRRFRLELEHATEAANYSRIDIVAHSFGTYLAIEALNSTRLSKSVKVDTVILCGSVLSPDRNLRRILGPAGRIKRIVNDCGTQDGVLLLTLLVLGVGMAGRLGLSGIQDRTLVNRFFRLGHSGYFEPKVDSSDPDSFMREWWVPVLLTEDEPRRHDDRTDAPGILERTWSALGANGAAFTISIYSVVLAGLAGGFAVLWQNAVHAEKSAVRQYASALSALSEIEVTRNQPTTATRLALLAQKEANNAGIDVPSAVWTALFAATQANHQRAIIYGHSEFGAPSQFSPDGTKVLTVGARGIPYLWTLDNSADPVLFKDDDDYVHSVEFSPDGKMILTSSRKYIARIWQVDQAVPPRTILENTKDYMFDATFSSSGEWIAVQSPPANSVEDIVIIKADGIDTSIPLRDGLANFQVSLQDYEKVFSDKSGGGKPSVYPEDWQTGGFWNSGLLSPDGLKAVTIPPILRDDKAARVWSRDEDTETLVLRGHTDEILYADFSPDSKRLVTGSRDGTARIWDLSGTRETIVLRGHVGRVHRAIFSPTGEQVLTEGQDGTVRVWDATGSDNALILKGHSKAVSTIDFSPDSTRVVTASADGRAITWSVHDGAQLSELAPTAGALRSAVFDLSGKQVLTTSEAGAAQVWNSNTGRAVAGFGGPSDRVLAAAFDPSGERVATGHASGAVKTWRADGQGLPTVINPGGEGIDHVVFGPRGRFLLATSDTFGDAPPRLWDADTGNAPREFVGHKGGAMMGAFNSSGSRFVTASRDKTAIVWDAQGHEDPKILKGHVNYVRVAKFSPDGKRVLTASEDFTARIWDVETEASPIILRGHSGIVVSAEFSPDGTRVVTSSGVNWDNSARIWNADGSGVPVLLLGHSDIVNEAVFSPNGQWIATASGDGTARIWPVSGPALVSLACARISEKSFTEEELKRFALLDPGPVCDD